MMNKIVVVAIGTLLLAACGGADSGAVAGNESVAATDQAVVNGWIGPVSEESWKSQKTCSADSAAPGMGAVAAFCAGSNCDDMYLFCGAVPSGFFTNGIDRGWSAPFISEENGANGVLCPSGSIVDGIRATGRFADNISVHCTGASFPAQGVNCQWTPYFSEEQGQQNFFGPGGTTAVARGVRCRGSFCDDMSYNVCEPKCTSNAQCSAGRACFQGACAPIIP